MSRPEIAARLAEIELRMKELNVEFEGTRFSEDARGEWDSLGTEKDELRMLDEELEVREGVVAEAIRGGDTEQSTSARVFNINVEKRTEDIYDVGEIRRTASSPEQEVRALRDNAKHALEKSVYPNPDVDRAYAERFAERLLTHTHEAIPGDVARRILTTGSPAYRRAFGKTLAGTPLTNDETRAMSLTGSGGGFAIPFALDPTIIPTSNLVVNPTRALARTVQISGANTWEGVTAGSVTATRVAEATEATDNSPTLVQPTATVTKAHCFIPYSIEVGEDWGALEAEMGRLIQNGKDEEEGVAFVTGSGAGVNPQGFVTGTTNTVAAATGLTVTGANIYALENALPPRFRPNESFVANRGIYNIVRNIDTAGGAMLWLYVSQGLNSQVPTPGNTGATLLGRGAWEASGMQATVVNATKIMIVGDFNYFLIVDRIGMTVELIPHIFGATARYPIGQRGLYTYWRNTSKVLSANAFVALTGTT